MEHPATKKRGADPEVPHKPAHEKPTKLWSENSSRDWRRAWLAPTR